MAKNIHNKLRTIYDDAACALPSVYFWIRELKRDCAQIFVIKFGTTTSQKNVELYVSPFGTPARLWIALTNHETKIRRSLTLILCFTRTESLSRASARSIHLRNGSKTRTRPRWLYVRSSLAILSAIAPETRSKVWHDFASAWHQGCMGFMKDGTFEVLSLCAKLAGTSLLQSWSV
jgi:hypothetical protein